MNYEQFMQECKAACHERNACADGYQQLLRSQTVPEILLTVVHNWQDVWRSKYSDIVAKNVVRWFTGLEQEFHDAGFFINEETDKGIAVVARPDKVLHFSGRARVYIFDKAHVTACDHCEVYCRNAESEIELFDYAYGKIEAGKVSARDWATVESHQECACYNHTTILVSEGILHDHGHLRLTTGDNVTII